MKHKRGNTYAIKLADGQAIKTNDLDLLQSIVDAMKDGVLVKRNGWVLNTKNIVCIVLENE